MWHKRVEQVTERFQMCLFVYRASSLAERNATAAALFSKCCGFLFCWFVFGCFLNEACETSVDISEKTRASWKTRCLRSQQRAERDEKNHNSVWKWKEPRIAVRVTGDVNKTRVDCEVNMFFCVRPDKLLSHLPL